MKQRRAGTYYLEETLTLAPEDSGVTYAAYPGERAILSGGRPITGWTRKENARLLTAPAPFDFHQLFIGGRRAVRVRAPHHGFYRVDGRIMQAKPAVFKFRGDTISKAWAEKGDVEVTVLCAWQEVRGRITAVDEAAHTVQLAAEAPPNMLRGGRDCTYWVENTPEPPTYLLGHNWKGGLKMDHNLYWDARGLEVRPAGQSWKEWQASGTDQNSVIADPMFVNPDNFDFHLKPGSPALKMGFQQIDTSTVGTRGTAGPAGAPRK